MSKLLTTLVAILIAAACLPLSPAASAAPRKGAVASEWKETMATRKGNVITSAQDSPQHGVHERDGARVAVQAVPRSTQSTTYTSRVNEAPQPFTAVGPHWKAVAPAGAAVEVSVRTSADGRTWKPWRLTEENHGDESNDRDGRTFGSLVVGDLARFAQYRITTFPNARGEWPRVSDLTLTYIDSSAGPTAEQAQAASTSFQTQATGRPAIISRAGWGADESLRFDASGKEIWEKTYLQVTKAIIHDTVTRNNDPNPAATMRSIYYYHAVTRGWGDIGYNYLVDEQGRIYEGRHGGQNVVGGHTICYNWASVGIAALGWHGPAYGGTPAGVAPTDAMVRAIERIVAWQFGTYGIDPQGHGIFMNRYVNPTADVPNIMGHIDASRSSVPCDNTHVDPGSYLYSRFGEIRRNVSAMMGYTPVPRPVIKSVTFSPTTLAQGGNLRVDVVVHNAGTGLMETQGPNPAVIYLESQDYMDLGRAKVPGKYRVFIDQSSNPTGNAGPYRFGLGSPLLPGETRTVTGYITLPRTGQATWWAGLNKEAVSTVVDRTGATVITVVQDGASLPTASIPTVSAAAFSPNGDGRKDSTTLSTTFSETVSWTLSIRDSAGTRVRAYTGRGTQMSATWDGRNAAGTVVPDGTYRYQLTYKDAAGDPGYAREGVLRVDTVRPSISMPTASGYGPYVAQFKVSEDTLVSYTIANSASVVVARRPNASRPAGARSFTWNGALPGGGYAPGGAYAWRLYAEDLAGNRASAYPAWARFQVSPPDLVVDNAHAGYAASSAWTSGAYGAPYGSNYEYRSADGSAADPALFRGRLAAGTYDVYTWYTEGTNRSTAARYTLKTSSGAPTVAVNQQANGGKWVLLGRYPLASGDNTVSLSAANGSAGYIIADAVRWVRR